MLTTRCLSPAFADGDYQCDQGVRQRHGQGTLVNGPEKYVGGWVADSMEGEGSYLFASLATYEVR